MKKILSKIHVRNITTASLVLLCCVFVVSCTTDYNLSTSDYDTQITLYVPGVDFSSYKTYLMPDTIMHLVGEGDKDDISRKYDALIISNIESNFAARGYVKLSDTTVQKVDFVVALTAYSSTYVGYYYDYWYYWGYYPPYGGYWGPGYGYYPPVTYSYTTGSLIISMIDPAKSDVVNKKISPMWFGRISGLLGDTYSSTQTRILNALNQTFAQSPYLESGK